MRLALALISGPARVSAHTCQNIGFPALESPLNSLLATYCTAKQHRERTEPVDTAAAGSLHQICLLEVLMRLLVLPASGVACFFSSAS